MSFNFVKINSKESACFEFLKLFLLLEVVLGHTIAMCIPQISELSTNTIGDFFLLIFKVCFSFGRESAYLFVFLSGFFTAKAFFSLAQPFSLYDVIKKRLLRIYPIFIISIFLTLFIDLIGMYVFEFGVYQINGLNSPVLDHFSSYLFFTNLLSLQPTFSQTFGSNGPLWTLGYLVQFFIVATLLRKISGESMSRFSLIVILFIFLSWPLLGIEFSLLLFVWYVGVLLRFIDLKPVDINTILLFILIAMLFCMSKFSSKYISMLLTPVNGLLILSLIKKIPNVFLGVKISKFPKMPDVSYSLYAIHMPILFFIYGLLTYLFGTGYIQKHYVIYILIGIMLSILASMLILRIPKIKWVKYEK